MAWTTTPWTLPSNTALAVGGKIKYVKVRTFNPYTKKKVSVILADELKLKWFDEKQFGTDFSAYDSQKDKIIPAEVVASYLGSELELIEYYQLLPYAQPDDGDAFTFGITITQFPGLLGVVTTEAGLTVTLGVVPSKTKLPP